MCPNESWPELNSKLVANGCLKVHCASRLNVMCMRINIPQRQVLSCTVSFFLLILLSNQNILLLCFEPVLNTREILFPWLHNTLFYSTILLMDPMHATLTIHQQVRPQAFYILTICYNLIHVYWYLPINSAFPSLWIIFSFAFLLHISIFLTKNKIASPSRTPPKVLVWCNRPSRFTIWTLCSYRDTYQVIQLSWVDLRMKKQVLSNMFSL